MAGTDRSGTSLIVFCLLLSGASPAAAAETEALQIERNLVRRHLPFGTVLDPFLDPDGRVTGYSRCADSAIWTGHYLAAAAFRHKVTGSPQALERVRMALRGVRSLVDVTGSNRLARCLFPVTSRFGGGILAEEAHHGVYQGAWDGRDHYWIGNTSRDQFAGVFFGLGVAWEFVEDQQVRREAADLGTRLLDRLLKDDWAVTMPDGAVSTLFWQRPDQRLTLLLIGSRLNPERFRGKYETARFLEGASVTVPIAAEALDPHGAYFKFNLAAINLYHLARWETNGTYRWFYMRAFETWREAVDTHDNAHFNVIDRAVRGPDPARDAQTWALLQAWLKRGQWNERLDWRGEYTECGENRACEPIPVEKRIRTDFLWQRSPFQLYGGGSGPIESAGIDYLLPYWMGRYFGVWTLDDELDPDRLPAPAVRSVGRGIGRAGVPSIRRRP